MCKGGDRVAMEDPMRVHPTSKTAAPDRNAVLSKAVLRAAESLDVSDARLAGVIGVSASTLSRMRSAARTIDPSTKEVSSRSRSSGCTAA